MLLRYPATSGVVKLRHALEEIEILFVTRLQLWVDRLFQVSAKLCEIKFLRKAEHSRVRVYESTPETSGPMARECEMEVEDLSGHLGQYAGDAADSFADSSQQLRLVHSVFALSAHREIAASSASSELSKPACWPSKASDETAAE